VEAVIPVIVIVGLLVGAILFGRRIIGANDRLDTSWVDAWLKTAVIVLAVALFTIYLPDLALKAAPVTRLSRFSQDLVGVGVWSIGFVGLVAVLWYAHKESRV